MDKYLRRYCGFTLIELMITVAVLGILAAIAYPSFLDQIRKSRRSDAVSALSALQQAQERWRSSNPAYGSLADIGINAASPNGYYTLAISGTPTSTGYTATATPVSGKSQAADTPCATITVTITNGTPDYTPAACWSQ